MTQAQLIVATMFLIIAIASMAVARFIFKVQQPVVLLIVATVAGALVGGWLAQAGSAMASSVNPRDAFLSGALRGGLMSAVSGGVLLLIKHFLK